MRYPYRLIPPLLLAYACGATSTSGWFWFWVVAMAAAFWWAVS